MSKQIAEPWIWWKHGVIYHIYPRSFQDSNSDGIGDIRGIIRRLGYLKELGIDGIWISPMYKSPMVDFGYDVSGYREIDPSFGTMDDFMELLETAHAYGIRAFQKHIYTRNRKRSVTVVTQIRKLLDQYENTIAIGEIYSLHPGNAKAAAKYLVKGHDGIHLAFDFSLIFSAWNAHSYYKCIKKWYDSIPEAGWPCNVLSNHDLLRSIDRIPWRTNMEEKAKVAAALLLTLRGTLFIYYGEEIGMHNGNIRKRNIRDPLGKRFWPLFTGRDKARTPMQWEREPNGGFTDGIPWMPLNSDTRSRNVRQQEGELRSLLNH